MVNEAKNRHVVIQEWMLDYDLSPTELICYAIIFGFSQDGKSKFQGSASYLSKWTKTSRATIFNALKKLCDMNLIAKEEKVINGVKLCDYRVVQNFDTLSKIDTGVIKNLDGGYQNFCLHNIEDNIDDNNTPYNPPKGESQPKKNVFKAPTVEEVEAYGKSKGFTKTDYIDFWEFYENKGWKVGNIKMKSWQLALNRWERNQKGKIGYGIDKRYNQKDTSNNSGSCNSSSVYSEFEFRDDD